MWRCTRSDIALQRWCVMRVPDSPGPCRQTRMQSLSPSPAARYRSVGDALWRMVRHEGVLRPVRGMSAVVAGAGPAHALYFASYENLRDAIQRARVMPHSVAPALAGAAATLLHDAVMTPADGQCT